MFNEFQATGLAVPPLQLHTKLPAFDLDTFRDKTYLTHGLHPYPAKFVPQIPQLLLSALVAPGAVVLDPFCGSGTTLAEAMLAGALPIGVDSNELAVKIAKAKTSILSDAVATELYVWSEKLDRLTAKFLAGSSAMPVQAVIPEFKNRDHWFTPDACLELGLIRGLIDQETAHDAAKNIIDVVFSSIIVKCSRQESDTRWCAVDKAFDRGDALALMRVRLKVAIARLTEFANRSTAPGPARIACEDTRNMTSVGSGSIDAIITSPPYLNSFDYYLYHKLRMFWLGIDHYKIQKSEIGSRNKHCDNNQGIDVFTTAMSECIGEFNRVLHNDGVIAIVIGDSIYQGELIPMDVMYCQLMEQRNFRLLDQFSFDQRKYTRAFTPNIKTKDKKSHIMLFRR